MANVRRGNIHYVDSTGVLTTRIEDKIAGIILTSTTNNASVTFQTDSSDNQNLFTLKEPTAGISQHFDFTAAPLVFGLKGLQVSAISNCVCTVIYTQKGSGVNE